MKMKSKANFVNPFIFLLFCIALFLGFKINVKQNWIQIPAIGTWLPYENWFQFYDHEVSASIEYHHLVDDMYTNGTNSCASLFDGIVLKTDEESVTVLHDNGVLGVYAQLEDVVVKGDERVLKGQSLGIFKDSLKLEFKKDDQKLSYEEVVKL